MLYILPSSFRFWVRAEGFFRFRVRVGGVSIARSFSFGILYPLRICFIVLLALVAFLRGEALPGGLTPSRPLVPRWREELSTLIGYSPFIYMLSTCTGGDPRLGPLGVRWALSPALERGNFVTDHAGRRGGGSEGTSIPRR